MDTDLGIPLPSQQTPLSTNIGDICQASLNFANCYRTIIAISGVAILGAAALAGSWLLAGAAAAVPDKYTSTGFYIK